MYKHRDGKVSESRAEAMVHVNAMYQGLLDTITKSYVAGMKYDVADDRGMASKAVDDVCKAHRDYLVASKEYDAARLWIRK